ncbi:hypothetical protein DM558_13945 [Entomomonas moraniae]|uniref:Zinc ribbon domain-containing protein n=1 Tax=Entomomonas moraniae TaxID=2213226 RepID=A0A451EPR0_9GAMM|nr:hypothetical protein [Entomomonas moraniae]AZS51799.1 hypothetical protein DM558_13945 [Entomomonas moraniae]
MALITCNLCSQSISDKARACPCCRCEHRQNDDDEIKQNILLTLIPLVALIILVCIWNLIVNIIAGLIIAAIVIAIIVALMYIIAGMAN